MSYLITLRKATISEVQQKSFEDIIVSTDKDYIYVDIEKLYNSSTHDSWLTDFGQHIDYDKSKITIEKLHRISDVDMIKEIDSLIFEGKFDCKTYKELKEDFNFNFSDSTYKENNYHILSLDSNGKLKPAEINNYNLQLFCFSSPFLASIIDNNNVTSENTKFYFVLFNNKLNTDLALGIKISSNINKYYDFSQNPPPTLIFDRNNPNSYGNKNGNPFYVGSKLLTEFNGKEMIRLIERR